MSFCQSRNLPCLSKTTNTVRVELNLIQGLGVQELTKTVERKLMLNARDWDSPSILQGGVSGSWR